MSGCSNATPQIKPKGSSDDELTEEEQNAIRTIATIGPDFLDTEQEKNKPPSSEQPNDD